MRSGGQAIVCHRPTLKDMDQPQSPCRRDYDKALGTQSRADPPTQGTLPSAVSAAPLQVAHQRWPDPARRRGSCELILIVHARAIWRRLIFRTTLAPPKVARN